MYQYFLLRTPQKVSISQYSLYSIVEPPIYVCTANGLVIFSEFCVRDAKLYVDCNFQKGRTLKMISGLG